MFYNITKRSPYLWVNAAQTAPTAHGQSGVINVDTVHCRLHSVGISRMTDHHLEMSTTVGQDGIIIGDYNDGMVCYSLMNPVSI